MVMADQAGVRAIPVLPVTLETPATMAQEGQAVLRAVRAIPGPQGTLETPETTERRVTEARLEGQAIPETPALLAMLEQLVAVAVAVALGAIL